jgi:tRNA 2-selenouridine synthase
MAVKRLDIDSFLAMARTYPVADVRSPDEFTHAHIPNAFSLPLFTNDERVVVGTTYKQQSRENAIKIGLDYFGPKMKSIVVQVEELLQEKKTKIILVHCWRGGMRSAAIAWLLDLYGFEVYTLQGGYKAFRNWVLKQFEKSYPLQVLGGYTGSSKTETLLGMQQKGSVIIDLEGLANHKGSAFGSLGLPPQPSAEMFENMLAIHLRRAVEKLAENKQSFIWVEAESQRIGNINLPHIFFKQMKDAPYLFVDIPFEERLDFIIKWYGKFDKGELINAILRIRKRLGGLDTKQAINFLLEDNIFESFSILLKYYDKYYERSNLAEAKPINKIQLPSTNAAYNSTALIAWAQKQ